MKSVFAACALVASLMSGGAHAQSFPDMSLGDIAAANAAFDQQWQMNLDQGMANLLAYCEHHRRTTGTACLAGYDASAWTNATTGGDAYVSGMQDNSARMGAAMNGWSQSTTGSAPGYADGRTYWSDPTATSAWVNRSTGDVWNNMSGHDAPLSGDWTRLEPGPGNGGGYE